MSSAALATFKHRATDDRGDTVPTQLSPLRALQRPIVKIHHWRPARTATPARAAASRANCTPRSY
eukprot:14242255-Alexandrium_andersonii.AAC.1